MHPALLLSLLFANPQAGIDQLRRECVLPAEDAPEIQACRPISLAVVASRGASTYHAVLARVRPAPDYLPADAATYVQIWRLRSGAGRAELLWSHLPGDGWIDGPPRAYRSGEAIVLVVPVRIHGTGAITDDQAWLVETSGLRTVDTTSWVRDVKAPARYRLHQLSRIDWNTMTATAALAAPEDPNCCPSGGELKFRLRLQGDRVALRPGGQRIE